MQKKQEQMSYYWDREQEYMEHNTVGFLAETVPGRDVDYTQIKDDKIVIRRKKRIQHYKK